MLNKSATIQILLGTCLLASAFIAPHVRAEVATAHSNQITVANDDNNFVFIGHCANGDSYRIFSYQLAVNGDSQVFYQYEGPAGKGTVRTNISPKKMAIRVCYASADLRDGSIYD